MEEDLETEILPTPQRADLKQSVFPGGKVLMVRPDRYETSGTFIGELGSILGVAGDDPPAEVGASSFARLEADTIVFVGRLNRLPAWSESIERHGLKPLLDETAGKGADSYVLFSAARAYRGKNIVILAGNSHAADLWALATLRQMVFQHERTHYVREGRILDFPRFRLRGNKRPRLWEWRYKANYAWFFDQDRFSEGVPLRDYHRRPAAWIHHGAPLRATDGEMDELIEGRPARAGIRAIRGARQCYQAGCREFVLKFDDTSGELSEATRKEFSRGNDTAAYFQALHHFLLGMHRRIKAVDSENTVFFMPRPYWHNAFEQRAFAEALLAHGPLPKDIGLSVCGPEVISWTIPTRCLTDYRKLYGVEGKAQVYDNFGRGGEYFAYTGRDVDLWQEVECVFPERGTPVTRITVYDYLWNPEAYDPERSLRLAVRELAGRDPQLYRALWEYISYYNRYRDFAGYPAREEVLRRLPKLNQSLEKRFNALVPLLSRSPAAEEVKLQFELWGPESPRTSHEWGEYARLRRRLEYTPYMLAYGYREGEVTPTDSLIAVDGKLDEPAWESAKRSLPFVRPAWGRKEPPGDLAEFELHPKEATRLTMLYNDTHLFVGCEMHYAERPELPLWAQQQWRDKRSGEPVNFGWRVPCIELLFDTTGKREHYHHLVGNIAGHWVSTHCRAYVSEQTGGWWRPDWRFKFRLGEKRGAFEASIPLADLTETSPQPGTVWGFQAYRSKIGSFSMFSGVYDLVGGEHGTRQFGRIVFR
jgi:hypothetical protein